MNGKKLRGRQAARRSDWDKHFGGREGFKRPGSFKKAYPAGVGKSHK